jgi:tRNA uridine 5-carbamoylmethylation protein Kti12
VLENSIPLSIFPIQADRFCFCFCGLPARGKTHIARRLAKYLTFFHAVPVEIFNSAEYRRRLCHSVSDLDWFDPTNAEAQEQREQCHRTIVEDMIVFLKKHPNGIAIMDSINPTHERRKHILTNVSLVYFGSPFFVCVYVNFVVHSVPVPGVLFLFNFAPFSPLFP